MSEKIASIMYKLSNIKIKDKATPNVLFLNRSCATRSTTSEIATGLTRIADNAQ